MYTREEADLADEQPLVGEGEVAAQDVCDSAAQRQRDRARGGVAQVAEGYGHAQGRLDPQAQQARLELAHHLGEHAHTLGVPVVAVNLRTHGPRGRRGF